MEKKLTRRMLSPVFLLTAGTLLFVQSCSREFDSESPESGPSKNIINSLSDKDFQNLKGKSLEQLGINSIDDLKKNGWKKIDTQLITKTSRTRVNYSRETPTDGLEVNNKRLITNQNLLELGITDDILSSPNLKYSYNGQDYFPVGISINSQGYGEEILPNATERKWYSYLNAGVPLVEEETNISQPSPLILNSSVFNNLSTASNTFNVSLNYDVSTTTKFNVTASTGITFGDKVIVTEQEENSTTTTTKSPVVDVAVGKTSTVLGSNETHVDVTFGATAGFEKAKTINIGTQSSYAGTVPGMSRVKVLAIQRKKVKKYKYTIPVTFGGFIGVKYPVPASRYVPPQAAGPDQEIVARPISLLDILTRNNYRQVGYIETVEEIECEFYQFAPEPIANMPL